MTARYLADTHAQAFADSRTWSEREFAELLDQRGVTLIGDKRSFLLTRQILDEVEILTLATHPDNRQQGLAFQNLQTLLRHAKTDGAKKVFLEVAADNNAALQLYAKAGFAQIGSRSAYYARTNGPAVDALILQRKLDPA